MGQDDGVDELWVLRRRAYGPEADIAADPAARARLALLESQRQARRAADAPVIEDASQDADSADAADASDAAAPDTETPAAAEPEPEDPPAPAAAAPRRRVIAACAITAVATVAVVVPATLGAIAFADRPDAVLRPIDTAEPVRYFQSPLAEGSRVYGDFYGIDIIVGSFAPTSDTCLFLRFSADSGTGACVPRGVDPHFDVATRDAPSEARAEFGDDSVLRFVVAGDDVLIYVVRPGEQRPTPAPVDDA